MSPITVAKVVLINPSGRVLLLRRSVEDDRRPNGWDFPGGEVEEGEDTENAARREVREETGIDLGHTALLLAFTKTEERHWGQIVHKQLFIAKLGYEPKIKLCAEEHAHFEWQSVPDALETFQHPFYNKGLRIAYEQGWAA